MKFGKAVSDVVQTFPSIRQRPADTFVPVPLFASIDWREANRLVLDQAQSVDGQAAWVDDFRPSRTQADQRTGVYEVDQETYQASKVA